MCAGRCREPRCIRSPGRGSQRLHRALGGTRILLAAAPTAPPCFCRWQRSSLLHRGFFPRRTIRRVLRVALAAFSAAPWQGFEKAERCPSLASLFPPQAAVGSAAVRIHPCSPFSRQIKQKLQYCWVSVKQFSKNDTATACQDWLRSTRLGRGSIKSHVRTVKVLGMGLFAFQERVHLLKGVTH